MTYDKYQEYMRNFFEIKNLEQVKELINRIADSYDLPTCRICRSPTTLVIGFPTFRCVRDVKTWIFCMKPFITPATITSSLTICNGLW